MMIIKYKHIVFFILLSCSFSKSLSRIITTFDPPSKYQLIGKGINSNQIFSNHSYDNKSGINFSYEHLLFNRERFNVYMGGEFMVGRKSVSTVSFHSVYIMPSLSIFNKFVINSRFGITQLNTDQNNFDLTFGYVASIGLEYPISEKMAFLLSFSSYEMQNQKITASAGFNPPLLFNFGSDDIGIEDMELDLKYNKIGLSIIYGFEIITESEKNEKN